LGGAFETLTAQEIVEINRRMIQEFGGFLGNNNLLYSGSLEYLLNSIQGLLHDFDPYPSIIEKGAFLAWRIISGHIFVDGNKRTGMECCRLFLEINNYNMRIDDVVVSMALKIAKNEIDFSAFTEWVRDRTSFKNV
jgi:death-on-curing protein